MKIAVYAIAKNEIKHVDRWVKACQGADSIVVVDTGSIDGTYERLLEYPLEAHRANLSPFRFDVARNIALDFISPDIDVCVSLDLDEVPDPDLFDKIREGWKEDTGRAWVMWDTGNIWANNNRVHARHGYKWKYPCHEIIVPDAGKDNLIVIESCVRHLPDNDKSRGQYLDLLELGYKETPDESRMLVYLIREYYFKGMWKEIVELGPRIDDIKDVWNVELAQTYRGIGEAHCKLGNDQEGLKWYLKNVEVAPKDLEAWMPLAFYYYERGMWKECQEAADKVNELPNESYKHYIADDSMKWRMYDLLSIACWNLGLKGSAKKWARMAVELNPEDERLRGNYDFIVRQTVREYKDAHPHG
jgi:glycosyltransferase involved in cell wall biosynthesis